MTIERAAEQSAALSIHVRRAVPFLTTRAEKLIRQYIPKGTDISKLTDKRIKAILAKINGKPREKLKFYTPNEVFFKYYT